MHATSKWMIVGLLACAFGERSAQAIPAIVAPTFQKSYTVANLKVNATTPLNFSITNNDPTIFLTNAAFTDTLPAGLQFDTSFITQTFGCGGSAVITVTATMLTVSGATIGPIGYIGGNQCFIGLQVKGILPGVQHNATSTLTSDQTSAPAATADVNVVAPPTFAKAYNTNAIFLGDTTPLQFTIANPNASQLTNVSFTDTLPSGLESVSNTPVVTFGCGAGLIITGAPSAINASGIVINANDQCVITMTVKGTSLGLKDNTTSKVTSNEADPSNVATASIFVGRFYQTRYFSNLNVGDSYINITNDGSINSSSATAIPASQDICVNVYTFDPAEELISCCACRVTPNALVSLSVRNDLISNTLTPATPTSVVVKLAASNVGSASGFACNAASVQPIDLNLAMKAFGATLHLKTSASPAAYDTTETPFDEAALSRSEFSRVALLCGFIQANGSGFGICKSCRAGGLGADRQ